MPYVGAPLSPFVAVLSMVPPLAILPILFIVLRPGRAVEGDADRASASPRSWSATWHSASAEMPVELLIKAQTLGASTWQIVLRVVLPQVLPRLLDPACACRSARPGCS